jgi:HD-GYP domain-containing protein (c-di-GMP phosphodiesterase class II)/phosphoribosyl 1,2-cyclic phosphodiesterase
MKNSIKILGAYGSKTLNTAMTCILTDHDVLIDAGNILHALDDDARKINHILLTHAHLDHIADIPFLIDIFFEARNTPLIIYGTKGTLAALKEHILNWNIWPDFTEIPLTTSNEPAIKFQEIALNMEFTINETTYKPIKTNHTSSSCGYVITKEQYAVFFTADTYQSELIWQEVNENPKIKSIIIDVSFPSALDQLAIDSKHLTPKRLDEDMRNHLKRKDVKVFINHLKPIFIETIKDEIKTQYPDLFQGGCIINDGDILELKTGTISEHLTKAQQDKRNVNQLIDIGHALTNEKDFDTLMEKILKGAKELSNADGGTLYLVTEDQRSLSFTVVQTDSLGIKMGGTQGEITWPNVELYKEDGNENFEQVAALSALTGRLINIDDVYYAEGFNFEGTKKFDAGTGYRTKSMLVVPMTNHEGNVIGVLQLLNKRDENEEIIPFKSEDEKLILSMSSQAAVSISNTRLIKELEKLLHDFIKTIADAINEKSKYTGGHINRVAEISLMIADAINNDASGVFKNIHLDEIEMRQLDIAAWMHDIGKITTPEYVVDKATKLETIFDRIEQVTTKFELAKRDREIQYLKDIANTSDDQNKEAITNAYLSDIKKFEDDLEFIRVTNKGGEFMEDEKVERLEQIAKTPLIIDGKETYLLNENELYNLSIKKGTLTQEERDVINYHVNMSYKMLSKLTFPKDLKRVPIIAASHHKTIWTDENGKHGGYGHEDIMSEPMTLEDKILAVADVFEAVTASDRPYKDPNSLNQSLKILTYMAKDDHLDYDIVKFFIDNKIYAQYAKDNLIPSQLDEVTVKL